MPTIFWLRVHAGSPTQIESESPVPELGSTTVGEVHDSPMMTQHASSAAAGMTVHQNVALAAADEDTDESAESNAASEGGRLSLAPMGGDLDESASAVDEVRSNASKHRIPDECRGDGVQLRLE